MPSPSTPNSPSPNDPKTGGGIMGPRVITPIGILDWYHLLSVDSKGTYATNKYTADILFPKGAKGPDGRDPLLGLVTAVQTFAKSLWPTVPWASVVKPWRDGDVKAASKDYLKGMWYLKSRTKIAPALIDNNKADLRGDPARAGGLLYRGARVRFLVTLFACPVKEELMRVRQTDGSVREEMEKVYQITTLLDAVQWAGHGDRLTGGEGVGEAALAAFDDGQVAPSTPASAEGGSLDPAGDDPLGSDEPAF